MKLSVDYCYNIEALDKLEIEDIGNCCILCNDDFGKSFVLIITTVLGITQVIEYGPFNIEGNNENLTNINSYYLRFDYSEYRIEKIIDKFLNNPKRLISQADCIEEEEAKKYVKNILENLDDKYC